MEILISAKKYFRFFGIFPMSKRNLPAAFHSILPLINFFHIIMIICGLLAYFFSIVYYLIFKVNSPIGLFLSLFFLSATLMRVTLYFLILIEKSEISILMNDLKKTIQRSKIDIFTKTTSLFVFICFCYLILGCVEPQILLIYLREIDESEQFTKTIFRWMVITGFVFPLLKVLETYYNLYVLHTGIQSYKMLMPIT